MALHQKQIALESIKDQDWTGKKVLDIGCSNGNLSLRVMRKTNAEELCGVDTAMDRISKACALANNNPTEKLSFFVANADNLKKIANDSFDIVFSNMAFRQFKDKQKSLEEIHRVLKRGGEAFINFNIEKSPTWYQQEVVYNKLFGDPNKEVSRAKNFDSSEFEPMVQKAGFTEIDIKIFDNVYYYQKFDEAVDENDDNFFAKEKGLTLEQNRKLNSELEKYMESTREEKGIPESWKIMFVKLRK
ncbi:MAG: class I SAM-dependent methyltransferase [bacterium]